MGKVVSMADDADFNFNDLVVIDGCMPRIASEAFFEKIHGAGVTAVCVSLVGQERHFFEALAEMNVYYNMVDAYSDKAMVAYTAADIEKAHRERKLALVFSFQNGTPVEDDWVNRLPVFYRNGLRMVQLTYNERNRLGDGVFEPEGRGLTLTGIQVVRELNRLGIVIDLSHVGIRSGMDAIELSTDPCVYSHANCRALTDSARNKTDEQIRAIAEKGGVIGITPYAPFCETARNVRPALNNYLDHIDYAVQLVGVDHVGIGTDIAEHWAVRWAGGTPRRYPDMVGNYTWKTIYAEGFHDLGLFPNVAEALLKRGYSGDDLRKIFGGNFLRVFRQVWGG